MKIPRSLKWFLLRFNPYYRGFHAGYNKCLRNMNCDPWPWGGG